MRALRRLEQGARRAPLRLLLAAWLLAGCPGEPAARAPEKVVALAPSNVEILFALGLGDRLVGVGDYVTYPVAAVALPKLGGLYNPNLEALAALEPDLVVLLESEKDLAGRLGALGIPSVTVDSDSLADTEAAFRTLAARMGVEAHGEVVVAAWKAALAPRPPPSGRPPRVLISLERPPGRPAELLSAGPGSFHAELLERLGAENLLADAPSAFPRVGLETILGRAPEVILEIAAEERTPAERAALVADWAAFPDIPAVAAGRVQVIAGSHTLVPGPRLPQLYAEMAEALKPDTAPAAGGPP
ncbi:MAG TPA: helical backbone metal receptor [Thermoanaerobaculia bacterium]|nr:helical backbone metal receptor [Thermoanaerobaculia bacterium]